MQFSASSWLGSMPRSVRFAVPIAGLAVGAAACGGGYGGSNAASAAHSAAAPSGVTLTARAGAGGGFLTDASGRSVYLWHADKASASNCSGSCATAWPPLTTNASVTAGSGVQASDIGTIVRSDGSKQITYNGHPLYVFAGDSKAGQTNGQGSTAFGAKWWLVNPAGDAITGTNGVGMY